MFPKNDSCHLACECGRIAKLPFSPVIEDYCFCSVSRIDIDEKSSGLVGRPKGRYSSIFLGGFSGLENDAKKEVTEKTAKELGAICTKFIGKTKKPGVLVAGLGNGRVTHDSLGAMVCEKLFPTESLYVFSIGVSGKSGIESAELVKSITRCSGAELVIAVDALAARSEERVGRVIQLSDSGIAPGSGAGARCDAINSKTVGVPVVSIGVPTVLYDEKMSKEGYLLVGEEILPLCECAADVISNAIKCFLEPNTE